MPTSAQIRSFSLTLTTPNAPGAVAIIQLSGGAVTQVLTAITGSADWPPGCMKFATFADIDTGLAVRLRDDLAQLMPHGGPRVVQKLLETLVAMGCVYDAHPLALQLFPEASSELEADMLAAIARAASPMAIDLLLRQPENWRQWLGTTDARNDADEPSAINLRKIVASSSVLDRLVTPPTVVVIGRPNVGKSTLTNHMLGRPASIVADMPGTTRDWVAGLAELPPGIAVRWLDTPGLRDSDDAIEQRAIELAGQVIRDADVLIAMRDPQIDWPERASLPREPDLWVMNKIDTNSGLDQEATGSASRADPLRLAAQTGKGVASLSRRVVEELGLTTIDASARWMFSDRLRDLIPRGKWLELHAYCGI